MTPGNKTAAIKPAIARIARGWICGRFQVRALEEHWRLGFIIVGWWRGAGTVFESIKWAGDVFGFRTLSRNDTQAGRCNVTEEKAERRSTTGRSHRKSALASRKIPVVVLITNHWTQQDQAFNCLRLTRKIQSYGACTAKGLPTWANKKRSRKLRNLIN